jgi:hypothetical protein
MLCFASSHLTICDHVVDYIATGLADYLAAGADDLAAGADVLAAGVMI